MAPLRLMTFNVQMLPLAAMFITGQSDDAEERAERVAKAILGMPADEQPDVIAFNEVFDEDARDVLIDRLGSVWTNRVEKIDNTFDPEDSGLMLFSKLEFLLLPNGERSAYRLYQDDAGDDSKAAKAVGIVQVARPGDITTIAFTHMQAAYDQEDQYSDIRASQFLEILGALSDVLGPDARQWRNVVLIGDLNVRGDPGASGQEWRETFENPPIGAVFDDGWRTFMGMPDGSPPKDIGLSNIELATGKMQRLDYQCFRRPTGDGFEIVPHHMRIRLKHLSDHFGLESVVAPKVPNCTPSDAINYLGLPPFVGGDSTFKIVQLRYPYDGGYQWVHVAEAGTYTIYREPGLKVRIFLEDDLSHSTTAAGTLTIDKIPPEVDPSSLRGRFDPEGSTFACRQPFFIAITNDTAGANPQIAAFKHTGDVPERAIWLAPHTSMPSGFPAGQKLGTDDRCWFRARPVKTFAGAMRAERFLVQNPTKTWFRLTMMDSSFSELGAIEGQDAEHPIDFSTAGDEEVVFAMERGDQDVTDFSIFWYSPVCYLALDMPTGFYITEETGVDWSGDDEVRTRISVDGKLLFSGNWDDADEDERWPGFAEALGATLASALPGMRRLPFVDIIDIWYNEEDASTEGQRAKITPLGGSDPDFLSIRRNMRVDDSVSDGLYTLYCSLTRYPE